MATYNTQRYPLTRIVRKRGRPPNNRPHHDTGTPELVMKRLKGETAEMLDWLLERGLITRDQHWCGIHLRWLYTLRFGAPGVQAIDTTHMGGMEIRTNDNDWLEAREQEYQDALLSLARGNVAPAVIDICIFNERPAFIRNRKERALEKSWERFMTGMDILAAMWIKSS